MFDNLEKREKPNKKETAMMPVRCIWESTKSEQVKLGHGYMIDRLSIWIDSDGDAHGDVYNLMGKRIGIICLKHFTSL